MRCICHSSSDCLFDRAHAAATAFRRLDVVVSPFVLEIPVKWREGTMRSASTMSTMSAKGTASTERRSGAGWGIVRVRRRAWYSEASQSR